jgi:hypothetical protein
MCCDTSDGTLLLQLFRLLFPIQAVLKLPSVNKELVIPSEVIAWLQEEIVATDMTEQEVHRQAQVRYQTEFDRLSRHLDVLYDDRLEGRIIPGAVSERTTSSTSGCRGRGNLEGGRVTVVLPGAVKPSAAIELRKCNKP